MKSFSILLVAWLAATTAFAVVDPDPDMLGIYFDQTADENCLSIGASMPFHAYLVLTNPTPAGITAYEFGLDAVVPAGMEGMLFRLADYSPACTGCIFLNPPDPGGGDYYVGLPGSYPTEPATVLHAWQYMLLSPIPVELYLHATSVPSIPGDLPVVQDDEGTLMQVGLSTGGPLIPVATVNTDCVVDAEELSFGQVKALYR